MSRLAILTLLLLIIAIPFASAQDDDGSSATGNRLFFDDFSTLVNGWDRLKTAKLLVDYVDFNYQFLIRSPGVDVWSAPQTTIELDHYVVDVDAEILSESDGSFGLLLNYQNEDNFLVVVVTSTGDVEARARTEGEWEVLTTDEIETAETYHLQVINDYGDFEIIINDTPSINFNQPDLFGGSFGLYVQAGHGTIHVAFDNYLVHDLGGEA